MNVGPLRIEMIIATITERGQIGRILARTDVVRGLGGLLLLADKRAAAAVVAPGQFGNDGRRRRWYTRADGTSRGQGGDRYGRR
jgi:hypothetical protein